MEASEPTCMTSDQMLSQMAIALGLPKGTGYIDILAKVEALQSQRLKLVAENKKLHKHMKSDREESWRAIAAMSGVAGRARDRPCPRCHKKK